MNKKNLFILQLNRQDKQITNHSGFGNIKFAHQHYLTKSH